MIERERARGNPVPTVERAADALRGPLYYRAVFTGRPGTPEWARELVDHLLPA
ncbi:MAG TPA: TetR-like C-terminal domain-containing protein [Pseudonocardia sp.]